MGALASSFHGLASPSSPSKKIGQIGQLGSALLHPRGGGMPKAGSQGVPGFQPQKPGLGQQAQTLQQLAPQQAPQLGQPGAGAPPPGQPGGMGGLKPPETRGGQAKPSLSFGQDPNYKARYDTWMQQPIDSPQQPGQPGQPGQPPPPTATGGPQQPMTPGAAMGGTGQFGVGRRYPMGMLGRGGWGGGGFGGLNIQPTFPTGE